MNSDFPVYTTATDCQDCFKCIRYCPCKTIKIENGSASIINDLCVSCGRCVKICPVHAKKIRSDLSRAKFLLNDSPAKIIASLAPSYLTYFKNIPAANLIAALKKLGFFGVSETALGAQSVSAQCAKYLDEHGSGVYLSSACPSAVEYIRKYLSEHTNCIVPVVSPLLAHTKLLRQHFGADIKVIFFGPCAAKKIEADNFADDLDLALTFADLHEWLKQANINVETIATTADDDFIPQRAEEGRVYAFEGGMNDTLRAPNDDTHYLAISGLDNLKRMLSGDPSAARNRDKKVFIECLACAGGCINGAVMPSSAGSLSDIINTAIDYQNTNSRARAQNCDLSAQYLAEQITENEISERELKDILLSIGKKDLCDELNCGGCGYYTCRAFAKALFEGKAESSMCLFHLRQIAQKKGNALIRYIPAGVVIVDQHLKIIECNQQFAHLFGEDTRLAYHAVPGLPNVDLRTIIDFSDLFTAALASGKDLIKHNYPTGDKILNLSIFTIEPQRLIGAIMQDVTVSEFHREQISEKAREVIQKNVITVQKIAHYLGEHMAETEVLLREVASGYSTK